MIDIIIIAAVSNNNVIGNCGKIPWYISEDFKRFKDLTIGHSCVMGDVTYNSLPKKSRPLPGRDNIVLSKNKDFLLNNSDDIIKHKDLYFGIEEAKSIALKNGNNCIYVIGGASIYQQCISFATKLEITRIHESFEGDAFFPEINDGWKLINSEKKTGINRVNNKEISFSYETYTKS